MNSISIKKELFFEGPPGEAVYALSTSYCNKDTVSLIQAFRHEAEYNGTYYMPQRYVRCSSDNGRSWTLNGPIKKESAENRGSVIHYPPQYFFSESHERLIEIDHQIEISLAEDQFEGDCRARSGLIFYRLSSDGGKTWQPRRQVIHQGDSYDHKRWMPGIEYGRNGQGGDLMPYEQLENGTLVIGTHGWQVDETGALYRPHNHGFLRVAFLLGQFDEMANSIVWKISEFIQIEADRAFSGLCEPDLIYLGGNRLFTTMRCQGSKSLGIYSSRQCSLSEDGGRTWTSPRTLTYDDGAPVYVPASFARFVRGPKTGKIYWIANILKSPVHKQAPRYPLAIAEFDPHKLCLIRSSVAVIQDLPQGAPYCLDPDTTNHEETGRRYTNFGLYTDRESGDIVLTMPEQPKTSWQDFTADCYRYRISGL